MLLQRRRREKKRSRSRFLLVVAIGAPPRGCLRLFVAATLTMVLLVLQPAQHRGCLPLLLGSGRGASLVRERERDSKEKEKKEKRRSGVVAARVCEEKKNVSSLLSNDRFGSIPAQGPAAWRVPR